MNIWVGPIMNNKLSNKICEFIGIMNKLKFQLPQNILLTIYNSLILSQLNNCLLAWGYESKHLYKLQKRAIGIIDKRSRFSLDGTPVWHFVSRRGAGCCL